MCQDDHGKMAPPYVKGRKKVNAEHRKRAMPIKSMLFILATRSPSGFFSLRNAAGAVKLTVTRGPNAAQLAKVLTNQTSSGEPTPGGCAKSPPMIGPDTLPKSPHSI